MEGELWNEVYRVVRHVARAFVVRQVRRGRPDRYSMDVIALCLLWAAWRNQPVMRAMNELGSRKIRRRLRRSGFRLPAVVPHETTVQRRSQRADFQAFFQLLGRHLRRRLRPRRRQCMMDSTSLPVGRMSHDPDAALGVYRSYGYRWHVLTSEDGVILGSAVHPANVHDVRVAPTLVEQARSRGAIRWLVADAAYDSERLHHLIHQQLRARFIAPLNDRGKRRRCYRTPFRAWLSARWESPPVRRLWRQRSSIERVFSRLKSSQFGLWALPPWVRHLANVRRWIELKIVLYHASLARQRMRSTC